MNPERGGWKAKRGEIGRHRAALVHAVPLALPQGFTLLEVMVAVAILGMVLISLLGLKNRSIQDVVLSEHITTATLLAKREMTEMLQNTASRPTENETEGDFPEEEFKGYAWKKTIITLSPLVNVQITEIRVAVLWKEGERQEKVELVTYE